MFVSKLQKSVDPETALELVLTEFSSSGSNQVKHVLWAIPYFHQTIHGAVLFGTYYPSKICYQSWCEQSKDNKH